MIDSEGPHSRGQLMIITALLLAVLFVGLALVLNSAIYTENLASRSSNDAGVCSASDLQQDLRTDFVEMIDKTNARTGTTDHAQISAALERDLGVYNNITTSDCVRKGSWADFNIHDTKNGTRLRQTNESRDFTDTNGNWNWTLTSDVPDGGQFAMAIQSVSLYEDDLDTTLSTLSSRAFAVEFHLSSYGGSGDGIWRVYFYRGSMSDNVYAIVEQPDQNFSQMSLTDVDDIYNQTCIARGDTVSIQFSESLYGGKPCTELAFYDDIDAHEVAFKNARAEGALTDDTARARGSYDILIESTTFNQTAFEPFGSGQPFYQAAITEMRYSASVDSNDARFTIENARVVPHRNDPGGILRQHPRVEQLDITDRTADAGEPTFDVDWEVQDEDGDLDRVELYLVHKDDEVIVDSAEYNVSGHAAGGEDTLKDTRLTGGTGEEYNVVITVVDESGRTRMVAEPVVAG
jgi:hypothetical protein